MRMKRTFIGVRGAKDSPEVRQLQYVPHTIDEAFEIFIRAKKAEGVGPSTIKGYEDIMRYFRQWLDEDIQEINDINADLLRSYINYLMTERIPYAEDEQRNAIAKAYPYILLI